MIPIYICEDQEPIRNRLKAFIENICLVYELDYEVVLAAESPYQILDRLGQQPAQGIYFLDIDLKDDTMDGFKLGQEIRRLDTTGFLIYVTTHDEMLAQTFQYRLEAMDFIVKDDWQNLEDRIRGCLLQIRERMMAGDRSGKEYFVINVSSRVLHVPLDEIIYFETSVKKHVVSLCTNEEYIEFYGNLAQIQEQLGGQFIRVHRSYLVNRDHIRGFDTKEKTLILSNDSTCLVSRTMKKEIRSLLRGSDTDSEQL